MGEALGMIETKGLVALIEAADANLYRAKEAGRDRVVAAARPGSR